MEILVSNQNTGVITLKEITDLIGARHNDSMSKIEKLALEPSFGTLRKTRIVYNEQGQEVDTYLLTKKQAIAAGAKLNNSLLMKVIDRLEEMESQNTFKIPQTYHEALFLAAETEKQNQILLLENKKKSQFISNVVHSKNTYTATQVAKDLNISAILFNKILVEIGVLYYQNGTYALTSKYQSFNLTTIKETNPDANHKTYLSLRWTAVGKNWIVNNWTKALQKCNRDTFDEYNMQLLKNLPQLPMPKKSDRNF